MVYEKAGQILRKLAAKKGTLKSLVLADDVKEKKKMYALVCETLKYKTVIEQVVASSGFLKTEKNIDIHLALVLVYDLLFGKGIQGAKYKALVHKHKTRLNAELVRIKIKRKIVKNEELIPLEISRQVVLPRYARVNLLKSNVDHVIQLFVKEGYTLEQPLEDLSEIPKKTIRRDLHLPDVLVFAQGTDLHDHPLLLNGTIILQDKASCFPAYILNPPKNSHIIDACAAPGNKTSHLASLTNDQSVIFAFDQDARRLETLKKLCKRAGCKSIQAMHQDFLAINPNDETYRQVEYILLDPSCSGSGIVSRLDQLVDSLNSPEQQEILAENDARLAALADFQYRALIHAFKFPSIKRVVYSTCSKNEQENEAVVSKVLKSLKGQVKLVEKNEVLPTWHRRGWNGLEDVVRALPEEDYTIGFFVALFEKI